MAQQLQTFDSLGGFSVENTTLITDTKDLTNINTLQVKNSIFGDATSTSYIVRGNTTAVLTLDNTGTQIPLNSNTINFITAHIVGVNNTGAGHLSQKIESVVSVASNGSVQELSNLITIIKDSVPAGEIWTVELFDTGSANRFSYSVSKSGGAPGQTVKWLGYIQVVSIDWS
ncbi:virion structural protein [Cyanophage S-RIM32]|uniref:Virion structural protein n=1 Tax=Cyanophage S-RIM32 TaxID=1278479 RepID=A0A127KMH6_9CAUD|nr:virion structural protein [Cyanophage S-RIM32]AMO43116.1 virion structural protein [Cyanophage S-RIM32]